MHLADTFIQSDLQCIQAIHFSICQYSSKNDNSIITYVYIVPNPYEFLSSVQCRRCQAKWQPKSLFTFIVWKTDIIQINGDWGCQSPNLLKTSLSVFRCKTKVCHAGLEQHKNEYCKWWHFIHFWVNDCFNVCLRPLPHTLKKLLIFSCTLHCYSSYKN